MNILSGKKPLHQQSQAQLSSVQFNENIPPLDGATDSESPLTESPSFEIPSIPDLQNSPIPQENNQFMNNNISPLIDSSYDFSILKLEFFYYYYALLNFLYSYSGYVCFSISDHHVLDADDGLFQLYDFKTISVLLHLIHSIIDLFDGLCQVFSSILDVLQAIHHHSLPHPDLQLHYSLLIL